MSETDVCNNFGSSNTYQLVHPNLDVYAEHIAYLHFEAGDDIKLIKHIVVNHSAKGNFTHDFFRLHELEIESFDQAQGLVAQASAAAMALARSLKIDQA
jgi:hypothetical protein